MSKIDYSQFYIKNYMPSKDIKPVKPREFKQKKSKKSIFVFIIIFVLISSLVYANLKVSGYSFDTFKSWFSKTDNSKCFYLIIKKFDDRDKAYAQSLLVRQSGASGYIFQENNKYNVVYTVFLNKEDADKVAKKNAETEIVMKKINEKDEFYDYIVSVITDLALAAQQLESGLIYEARLLEICSVISSQLAEKKADYLTQSNSQKYIIILDLFIGGLSSLNFPSPTRVSLLSDLRYIISSVVMSCCV